jgi:SAM-dependent methyltransferase
VTERLLYWEARDTVERPARVTTGELMDDPHRSDQELRETLRDLAWINRWFGGRAFVRAYLDRVLPAWQARRAGQAPLALLDVATGGADIPVAAVEWGRSRGLPVRVVAVDRHPATARVARELVIAYPAISVVRADARALPFRDQSFDVCLCTLALHHLDPDDGLRLIRRLHRLARTGFLVVDLLRTRRAYAGVWLLTRLARSRLVRHDGPLSVRRALSWGEYRQLAAAAGVPGIRVVPLPPFRVALERIG